MSLKSIVGENATQVRVPGEVDSIQIPCLYAREWFMLEGTAAYLALVPIGSLEEWRDGIDGREFVSICANPDAVVVVKREKVVNNLQVHELTANERMVVVPRNVARVLECQRRKGLKGS